MTRWGVSRRAVLAGGVTGVGVTLSGCLTGTVGRAPSVDDSLLSFAESVDDGLEARTREVYVRTAGLVRNELREETTVRQIDVEEMRRQSAAWDWFGGDTVERLAHRALGLIDELYPDHAPDFAGSYSRDEHLLTLVGPAAEISDQLIAHELTHAIQYQAGGADEWERESVSIDRRNAKQGLLEGVAQFVEAAYVDGCDEFSACRLRSPAPAPIDDWEETWLLAYGAHANGHELADALYARGGWEAIWDAHRVPPTHTGQVLKPAWYPEREPAFLPGTQDPTGDWRVLGTQRLGMRAVFVTLWLAGAIDRDAMLTDSASATDEVFSTLLRYRSSVSDGWRGDRFVAFERDDGRYAWIWRIRFRDEAAARDADEAFRDWAAARETATDTSNVWERGDRYEALTRDRRDVVVGMAPERSAFAELSELLAV